MSSNNLRILYVNKLTAATGGLTPSNLLNDYKSQTSTSEAFTLTTSSLTGPVAVIAVLAEDTSATTMAVTTANGSGSDAETTTSLISNTSTVGYGGGKYLAAYFTLSANTTTFTVTFGKSVKVSRFLVGNYWSPTHNTSFGISVGYADATSSQRLQSGDQYITPGPRHKTLSLSLEYLTDAEKFRMFDIVKLLGKSNPLFVSAFPADTDVEREQMYSIYGRFSNLPNITYSMFTKYTTQLEVEEF
jgi:hypothetical protein